MAIKKNKNIQRTNTKIENKVTEPFKNNKKETKNLPEGIGYKIGVIFETGSVRGYLSETTEDMELKVLELMEVGFKKIVVKNRSNNKCISCISRSRC